MLAIKVVFECVLLSVLLIALVGVPAEAELPPASSQGELVTALKAQIEVMRSYDQRILATVYWSLGGLLTIAALLIGFGWFANFRVYERDKNALAQELRGQIIADTAKQRSEIEKVLGEAVTRLEERVREATKQQIDELSQEIKGVQKELSWEAAQLRYDVLTFQMREWMHQKNLVNALRIQTKKLAVALGIGDHFRIGDTLDEIVTTVRRISEEQPTLPPEANDLGELHELLRRVGPEFSVSVEQARKLLSALPSRDRR